MPVSEWLDRHSSAEIAELKAFDNLHPFAIGTWRIEDLIALVCKTLADLHTGESHSLDLFKLRYRKVGESIESTGGGGRREQTPEEMLVFVQALQAELEIIWDAKEAAERGECN